MTGNIGRRALLVRRLSVVAILLAAYAYHRTIAGLLPLATIGMVSFCAVANFAPALVLGLYWRRMHRYGVIAGLAGGFFVWFAAVLWPTMERGTALLILPAAGPLAWFDPMPRGFVVGLTVNLALLVGVSLLTRPQGRDQRQAEAFVGDAEPDALVAETGGQARDLAQLQELAGPLHRRRARRRGLRRSHRSPAPPPTSSSSGCCPAPSAPPPPASWWAPRAAAPCGCRARCARCCTTPPPPSATTPTCCARRWIMSASASRCSTPRASWRSGTSASPP